jgi:hypothetical protein
VIELASIDWPTVASLATAAGTLVLAIATFASVRSSNRSARTAELALQEQRRPVLAHSRFDDPVQKIMFVDGHRVSVPGGRAVLEHVEGVIYLVMSVRNVGAGIGVLQGWHASAGLNTRSEHADEHDYRSQTRDLYVPAGDVGLWQGALRDPTTDVHSALADAIDQREIISLELLYSDQAGGQRTISRFNVSPASDEGWITEVGRHWFLDQEGPR